MKHILTLLLLILLAPTTSADWGATNEGGYEEYVVDSFVQDRDNPATGTVFSRSVDVTPQHGYTITSSTAIIQVASTFKTASSSTGTYRFQFSWDAVNLPNCMWDIETTNQVLTQTNIFPHSVLYCKLTGAQLTPGTHTFALTRTTLAGTPATIDHEIITYKIDRSDLLEPSTMNDLIEAFNLLAPIILFFAVIVWAEVTSEPLIYILAVLIGAGVVIGMWTEIATLRWAITAVLLLLIGRGYIAYDGVHKQNMEN